MGNKKIKKNKEVSWDIVYQEKHEEMRRYRDYELNISSWVITILLAILVATFTTDYFQEVLPKLIISFVALVFTLAGIFSVLYASAKFEAHKTILYEELKLEPKKYRELWLQRKETDHRVIRRFGRPRNLIISVLCCLFVAIVSFLLIS